MFYEGKLEDGVTESDRKAPAGILWPDWERPIAFLPIEGGEVAGPDGASKENKAGSFWVANSWRT